jgi:hypothetical protein
MACSGTAFLSLELVEAASYDLPHPCDDPWNSQSPLFMWPLVDTELGMPALSHEDVWEVEV